MPCRQVQADPPKQRQFTALPKGSGRAIRKLPSRGRCAAPLKSGRGSSRGRREPKKQGKPEEHTSTRGAGSSTWGLGPLRRMAGSGVAREGTEAYRHKKVSGRASRRRGKGTSSSGEPCDFRSFGGSRKFSRFCRQAGGKPGHWSVSHGLKPEARQSHRRE